MFIKPVKVFLFLTFSIILSACNNENSSKKQASTATVQKQVAATPAPKKVIKTYDGPFGLTMGISNETLTKDFGFTADIKNPLMLNGIPPKPSNLFTIYWILAGKKTGICKITAFTESLEFNDSGNEIKSKVDEIADALSVKYGKGKHYDVGNEYIKPELWALSAEHGNAKYAYVWDAKNGQGFPKGLVSIIVEVEPIDIRTGYVTASYEFDNFTDCQKEQTELNSSNL
jgi:hypothetical protein